MSTSPAEISYGSMRKADGAWRANSKDTWWAQHREASLNWLALGLLLAAWNASDNGAPTPVPRRPEGLRNYSSVSVRAAHRTLSRNLTLSTD